MDQPRENLKASFGGYGFTHINTTAATTVAEKGLAFVALQMAEESVVSTTGPLDNLSSVTLPQHFILYGTFTGVTLASGSCIAYKGGVKKRP